MSEFLNSIIKRFIFRSNRSRYGNIPQNFYHLTNEFLKSLNYIIGIDQLLDYFPARIKEIFDANSVYIFIFEPITHRYLCRKTKGSDFRTLTETSFSSSDPLIKWLNVNKCSLDVTAQTGVVRFLPQHEQELLLRSNTAVVVPLLALNRLTGFLIVTKKVNPKFVIRELLSYTSWSLV